MAEPNPIKEIVAAAVAETLRQLADPAAPPPPIVSPWLTREQAAKFLQLHPTALDRFVRRGEIRASKHGQRYVRFRITDLEAWQQSGCEGGSHD